MIKPTLMQILACPQDKLPLEEHTAQGQSYLVNPRLNVAYPINEGIPVLLVDEAVAWPLNSEHNQ